MGSLVKQIIDGHRQLCAEAKLLKTSESYSLDYTSISYIL